MNNRPIFNTDQTIDQTQYYWFENGFSKEEIEQIVKKSAQYTSKDGTIIGNQKEVETTIRKSKIKWLPNNSEWTWVYDKLAAMAVEANNTLWKFDLHTIIDDIQFTEYEAGGGHYDWHVDIGPSTISHRKISIVVQLADPDDYEGGDFVLWDDCKVELGEGDILIFPSLFLFPHRVDEVTKNIRYSGVCWGC